MKKKPGPKTLCTPKMVRALSAEIERGASIESACGAVGIDRSTLTKWLQKAEEKVEPYLTTVTPLKRALATAVRHAEQRIFAGEQRWESSARWLESMRPDPWRRTERHEHEGGGKPIPVDMNLGTELLQKIIAAAQKPGVPGIGGKADG